MFTSLSLTLFLCHFGSRQGFFPKFVFFFSFSFLFLCWEQLPAARNEVDESSETEPKQRSREPGKNQYWAALRHSAELRGTAGLGDNSLRVCLYEQSPSHAVKALLNPMTNMYRYIYIYIFFFFKHLPQPLIESFWAMWSTAASVSHLPEEQPLSLKVQYRSNSVIRKKKQMRESRRIIIVTLTLHSMRR